MPGFAPLGEALGFMGGFVSLVRGLGSQKEASFRGKSLVRRVWE